VFEERLTQPALPSPTPIPFSTATPGGRVSVWMIQPTDLAATQAATLVQTGQMIGPVATATAIQAQIIAATQTAAAPTPQPAFQPTDCPAPRALAAPAQPGDFSQYPATMSVFLSNGGAPAVLEGVLREWGAITEQGGVVQADTDLTGDKLPEILINIFNPQTYNPEAILNAGQLFILGCDNGAYRLLYASPNNPGLALPLLHRVGDMNADVKAEVVYDRQTCTNGLCSREGSILSWNPVLGTFQTLNSQTIIALNGRLGVVDIDSDGILELTATSNPPPSAQSGPTRSVIDVWDWTGQNYVPALRTPDEARYRVHRLQDADADFFAGNYRSAIRGYFEVRDEANLLPWTVPDELARLRAFAAYRIVLSYARNNDERSDALLATLLAENPEGTPGAVYAQMGEVFLRTWREGAGLNGACQNALAIAASRPEALSFLNSYGTANRSYTLVELCPF
jgi:hypothetical protein